MEGGMTGENEDKSLGFKWLKKKGVGGKKNKVQFYESFLYDEVEYTLYDCVYMYKEGYPEPYIGKVIKIWEQLDKTKKVKVQWFFYVWEILNYLGDNKAQEKEIFIASGESSGVSNINPLEAIAGKCNVVCISKDSRNPQPSDEELEAADYIFYRTFDVQTCTILDKMDEKVGGLEIQHIFNRNKHEKASSIPKLTSEREEDTENTTVSDDTLQPSSQKPPDLSLTLKTDENNGKITGKGDFKHDETKVNKDPTIQVKAKERARSVQDSNNLNNRPGKKAKGDISIKPPHDDKEKLPVHENSVKGPTIQGNVKERETSTQDIDNLKDQNKKARSDNDIKPPKDKDSKENIPLHENDANGLTVLVKVKERATSEHDLVNLNARSGKRVRDDDAIKPSEGKDLKGKDVLHEDAVKTPTIQVKVEERETSTQDVDNLKDQNKKARSDNDIKPLKDKDSKEKIPLHENDANGLTVQVKVKERATSEHDLVNLNSRSGKRVRDDDAIKPSEGKDLKGKDVLHEDAVKTPTFQVKVKEKARGDNSIKLPKGKSEDNSIKLPKDKDLKEKVPVRENGVKASVTTCKLEEKLNDLHGKSLPRTGTGLKSAKDDASKKIKDDDSLNLSEDNNKNKIQNLSTYNNGSDDKDVKPTEEHKRSRLVLDSLETKKGFNKEQPDEKVRKLPSGKLPKVSADKNTKGAYQEFEITRRPAVDKSKWFRELPWEVRLQKAYEQGTLMLLQNLDPEYTYEEVEGIIWHAFNESCTAKMVQRTAISSPFSGQALVIFKAREATERVMKKLDNGILMLPNGRPLVGSRSPPLNLSGKESTFFGHLVIDKIKNQNQREMKDAVSTSHCSQPNTIEFEMAMEWCLLQSRSEIYWKNFYKEKREELKKLEHNLKQK